MNSDYTYVGVGVSNGVNKIWLMSIVVLNVNLIIYL